MEIVIGIVVMLVTVMIVYRLAYRGGYREGYRRGYGRAERMMAHGPAEDPFAMRPVATPLAWDGRERRSRTGDRERDSG